MGTTNDWNGFAPFDEDNPPLAELPQNMSSAQQLQQPPTTVPTPPPSSSSGAMATRVGSSISDLGQSIFHNLDKVSSTLVGEATASFFADQSCATIGMATPPPSLPMLRVVTSATSTDEGSLDSDLTDLESVDDDKTVQADNKAATLHERRIARLRADKRRIEWTRVEIGPPPVSPSAVSVTPPRRAGNKDRRAETAMTGRCKDLTGHYALQRIPELKKANTMTDGPACDNDEQKIRYGGVKEGLSSFAFVPLETADDEKNVPVGPPEERPEAPANKTSAVAKYGDGSDEDPNSAGVSPAANSFHDRKKKAGMSSLSKLALAAMFLIGCGLALILASVLLPSRGNNLRGEASSGASSTSLSSAGNNSTDITPSNQMSYKPTAAAAGVPSARVPTASPSASMQMASPGKAFYPTASPTSPPKSKPTEATVGNSETSPEPHNDDDETFSFYVIGKSPELIKTELKNIDDGEFFIHLGDIFSGKDQDCGKTAYDDAADLIGKAQLPVIVLPGDKDWIDCSNIRPKRALRLWRNSFVGIEQKWKGNSKIPSLVQRSEAYPENFAFMFRGALFIGINNVGDDDNEDEYNLREKGTRIFIKSQVKKFEDEPSLRSIIVLSHAHDSNDTFDWLSQRFGDKNVQLVQIHANKPSPNGSFLDIPIHEDAPIKFTVLNGSLRL
jgi:hypothetical protein